MGRCYLRENIIRAWEVQCRKTSDLVSPVRPVIVQVTKDVELLFSLNANSSAEFVFPVKWACFSKRYSDFDDLLMMRNLIVKGISIERHITSPHLSNFIEAHHENEGDRRKSTVIEKLQCFQIVSRLICFSVFFKQKNAYSLQKPCCHWNGILFENFGRFLFISLCENDVFDANIMPWTQFCRQATMLKVLNRSRLFDLTMTFLHPDHVQELLYTKGNFTRVGHINRNLRYRTQDSRSVA